MGNKQPVFIYKGFFLLLPLLCYAHCFPPTSMQKTEYQVPNQDLKQIFKLVPDSANRLLLIEMRLILGLGLANLMTKYCIAYFSTLHRYSPVVSQAAVKPLHSQISVREHGKAICVCAVQPYSAGNKDLLRNPPGTGPPALQPH